MASKVDQCAIKQLAESIGVHNASGEELATNPACAIGGCTNNIAPVTAAAAYAAIANQGVYCKPIIVQSIIDRLDDHCRAYIALAPFIHQDVDETTMDTLPWGWVWIGNNRGPDNGGPAYEDVLAFTPLALIPGFLKPLYKALTGWVDFQVCAFGVSLRVGPYLRTSITVGRGC